MPKPSHGAVWKTVWLQAPRESGIPPRGLAPLGFPPPREGLGQARLFPWNLSGSEELSATTIASCDTAPNAVLPKQGPPPAAPQSDHSPMAPKDRCQHAPESVRDRQRRLDGRARGAAPGHDRPDEPPILPGAQRVLAPVQLPSSRNAELRLLCVRGEDADVASKELHVIGGCALGRRPREAARPRRRGVLALGLHTLGGRGNWQAVWGRRRGYGRFRRCLRGG